jgi:hypothetical protein
MKENAGRRGAINVIKSNLYHFEKKAEEEVTQKMRIWHIDGQTILFSFLCQKSYLT